MYPLAAMLTPSKRGTQMNKMEQAAREHAKAWLAYQRSPQAKLDRIADQAQRAKHDIANGHSPKCSLTKCHSDCKK